LGASEARFATTPAVTAHTTLDFSLPYLHNCGVDISVVIPALNEEKNLPLLLPGLTSCFASLGLQGEIIVVDGGSTDRTTAVAQASGARVFVEGGTGFGAAIARGIREARGEYVVTMDGDNSHEPRYIGDMLEAARAADVVAASRYVPGGGAVCSAFRDLLSRVLNWWLRNLISLPIRDISGGFRMYRRRIFEEFELSGRHFDIQAEIAVKAYARGFRLAEVPFEYTPRVTGLTKARVWAYGWAFLKTGFRLWRLRNTVYFADYDHRAYTSRIPLQRLWHWSRYRLITSMLEGREPALDVGCGSWRYILTSGAVGIDLDIAKARYVRHQGARALCADASRLPFPDRTFREVLCTEVIEHLPEGNEIFRELARVTARGGNLVVTTPDYSSPVWRAIEWAYERMLPGAYAVHHITRYDAGLLLTALEDSGFKVTRRARMFRSILAVKAEKS